MVDPPGLVTVALLWLWKKQMLTASSSGESGNAVAACDKLMSLLTVRWAYCPPSRVLFLVAPNFPQRHLRRSLRPRSDHYRHRILDFRSVHSLVGLTFFPN